MHDDAGVDEAAATPRLTVGLLLTAVLGLLIALPTLAIDVYLPATPQVARDLASSTASVQLTLTTCLVGFVLGQVLAGPLSDRFGRRRPLLTGLVVFVAASAACAAATGVDTLVVLRLVQGTAGAFAVVIVRAVVRDLFDGIAVTRFLASLALVGGTAPVLAPVIGGQLLRITDWRGIFWVMGGAGALLLLGIIGLLPETLPSERRRRGGVPGALRSVRELLGDGAFVGYMVIGALAAASLFAYIAASPFVIQDIYHASPQSYSLLFAANALVNILFGQLNSRVLVGRFPQARVLAAGLVLVGVATLALLLIVCGVFGEVGLLTVSCGLCGLMAGLGLVIPNTNALMLVRASPETAGSASALVGASAFLAGALASPVVGLGGNRSALPMVLLQSSCAVLAAAYLVVLYRRYPERQLDGTVVEKNAEPT